MKEYSILSFVGLPEAYKQPKTAYIRIRKVMAPSAKKALGSFEMDKYDKSLGYVVHSKKLITPKAIALPSLINRLIYFIYYNFL